MKEDSFRHLLTSVNLALKPLGFKKTKDVFVLVRPDGNLGFVSFVKDRSASPSNDSTTFTVEASVASNKLLERFRKHLFYSPAGKPSPSDNHFLTRVGHELGYGKDFWWKIGPANYKDVTLEVVEAICQKLLPVIEREISDEAICSRLLSSFEQEVRLGPAYLLQLAYLLKELGDTDNFNKVAEHIEVTYGDSLFENRITNKKFLEELINNNLVMLPRRT